MGRAQLCRIRERYPKELGLWIQDPGTHPPPQGELFRHARKRSMARLRQIIDESRDNTIAIVAHAGILRIMIFSLLELRLTRLVRLDRTTAASISWTSMTMASRASISSTSLTTKDPYSLPGGLGLAAFPSVQPATASGKESNRGI